jgi:hypothetical protein
MFDDFLGGVGVVGNGVERSYFNNEPSKYGFDPHEGQYNPLTRPKTNRYLQYKSS